MDQTNKYQWSKFSPDRTEQFVIRTDDWEELRMKIGLVRGMLPTTESFPNDEGYKAHSPQQTQPAVPTCGVHGTPMKWLEGTSKAGKHYAFWSCGQKNADGTWCNFKPEK